ncbi:MAG: 3-phosphoserine/phosphohydroxythreonine transaminase [Burkholderiales bacterium]|nr:3-phosphoserine/phosphohydroxythreonine transaminase [Burkholderiales bacterium]
MSQIFNFSAGPAVLPREVLEQAAAEMTDWHGSGMSVMEMSHRGAEFGQIIGEAEADLRELLAVPEHYRVLFMQGGALAENAIVPLNLLRGGSADYLVTGSWSRQSAREAARYGTINMVVEPGEAAFTRIPPQAEWRLSRDASYLHLCSNETIDGVQFHWLPARGDAPHQLAPAIPLVVDASSDILSRPIDVSAYGCLYGGAQKNIGPAGLTLVIIREDLLGHAHPLCPSAFDYAVVAKNKSMFNTPPTYAIYIAGLVFKWLKRQGGVAGIAARNQAKAALLYDYIDASGFYQNRVAREDRSWMNVPFFLADPALDKEFLAGAQQRGLLQLKGHRSVGGMRASIYNAMPIEGVRTLVDYMKDFERSHG